jgi:streptogramin lyase
MLSNPLNVATGPSGEIWITDYGNNSIIEVIGLGSPTATPLSVAASSSNELLGYRP